MIKWGIIGLGKIAHKFVSDLKLVDGHMLYAVASRSASKAKVFAELYKAQKAYGSYQELLDDEEVNIVYIATPHNSHCLWTIEATRHKKHVLCEKPLAVNSREVERMVSSARDNNVFLMEALWSRFNPTILKVLEAIEAGKIGEIRYMHSDFCVELRGADDSRLWNPQLAGGALLDVGIYPIFLTYLLLGLPNKIVSLSEKYHTGVDSMTSALFSYKNALAHVSGSFLSNSQMKAKISGTLGEIIVHNPWHHTKGYSLITNEGEENFDYPYEGWGYVFEIEECGKCFQQGKIQSDLWSHQNSLDLVHIMDEIREQIDLIYPFEDKN